MLKLAESMTELAAHGETPFGCRILSAASAYGFQNRNVQFWSQEGGAALAMMDDAVFLETGRQTNWEEIAPFVRALGPRVFSCEESAAQELGFPVSSRGEIMALASDPAVLPQTPDGVEWDPSPREIYGLLERSQTFSFHPPEFEPFYLDLSFRTRHGAALTACVRRNMLPAACAVCTSLTPEAAVITAVACAPEFRRHGLGRMAVLALAQKLGRKHIYIFRAENENEKFYRSLGFEPCGRWAECSFDPLPETKIYP